MILLVLPSIIFLLQDAPAISLANCTCSKSKLEGGWCTACRAGYIAGLRIASLELFEVLDAHGHDYDPEKIQCEACKRAIQSQGFCDSCRIGFWKNQAYLSRLSYHLARGRVVEKVDCLACRGHRERPGWCEICGVGFIGNVAISSRDEFDRAKPEFERLVSAVEMLKRCEWCAVALFSDGYCTTCKIQYSGGRRIETKSGE